MYLLGVMEDEVCLAFRFCKEIEMFILFGLALINYIVII